MSIAYICDAATQSPPGELIQTTMSPSPETSSSLNIFGVISSSHQLSSAMVPSRNRVRTPVSSSLSQFQKCVLSRAFAGRPFVLSIRFFLRFGCSRRYRRICECPSILQLGHRAVDKIKVATEVGRDSVEVFKRSYIICRHPAVLSSGRVACHARCVVAAKQSVYIKFCEHRAFFSFEQKCLIHCLFPADH